MVASLPSKPAKLDARAAVAALKSQASIDSEIHGKSQPMDSLTLLVQENCQYFDSSLRINAHKFKGSRFYTAHLLQYKLTRFGRKIGFH